MSIPTRTSTPHRTTTGDSRWTTQVDGGVPLVMGAGRLTQTVVLTRRSLISFWQEKSRLVTSLMMPIILLLLFSQVFGTALTGSSSFPAGVTYIDYLVPAILVTTTMSSAMSSGVGIVTDLENGVMARFRALPISLMSVPAARSISDAIKGFGQAVIILSLAYVVLDYRPAGGALGALGAVLVSVVLGYALSWLYQALGATLRKAESVQSVSMLLMFPLMFASSAYVPVASLPAWLQIVAKANPLTYAVDAARGFSMGDVSWGTVGLTLLICTALTAVAAAWASRALRPL
jgi:ABC-2 type transport system permease protein